MNDFVPDGLRFLGLEFGATEREIKRAYAARLKLINAETEPARFAQLRAAYEQALTWAGWQLQVNAGAEPTGDTDLAPVVETGTVPDAQAALSKESQQTVSVDIESKPPSMSSGAYGGQRDSEQLSQPDQPEADEVPEKEAALSTVFLTAELDLNPVDTVALALEEFRTSMAFATSDFPAAVGALKEILGSARLSMMVERDRFEQLLAGAIAARSFGARTAVVFLATAQVFGWEDADTTRLHQIGVAGQHIWQLLTELVLLGPATRQRWLLLTEEPDSKTALQRIKADDRPESISPVLASLFFPEGHTKAWKLARTQAPVFSRLRDAAPRALKKNAALRGLFYLLLIPIAVVIMYLVLSGVQMKEGRNIQASCDQAYGNAMATKWKNLTVAEVGILNSCAATIPPLLCADRDALIESVGHAKRLINQDYLYSGALFGQDNIRLDLPDGTSFSVAKSMDCSSLWRFAQQGNWLGEGDEAAARQLIAQLSECPVLRNDTPALRELLTKTDAWPDTTNQRSRISVKQLVNEAQRPPLSQSSPAQRPWPACEAAFDNALQRRMGPIEFIAGSARHAQAILAHD